jgi:predicted RNA-binding Zn-ribbon protein involved in translation (DUF1610 family)
MLGTDGPYPEEAPVVSKPSHSEDEYFAREEALKLQRLHKEKMKDSTEAEREARKQAHWMKCPKCGWDLETLRYRDVEVEKCLSCGVMVLDDGELEKLGGAAEESSWLGDFFTLFRGSDKKGR